MIQVIHGNIEDTKTELKNIVKTLETEIKQIKKKCKNDINELKKQHRKDKIHRNNTVHAVKEIETAAEKAINPLAEKIANYSNIIPIKVNDVVINYRIYVAFIKKLQGLCVVEFTDEYGLVVQYWDKGKLNQAKGVIRLYDLSRHFIDFENLPIGRIVDGIESC